MHKTRRPIPVIFPEYGIYILESQHSKDFKMDWMQHDFYKLLLAVDGSGSITFGDHKVSFEKNDVIWIPPNKKHIIEDRKHHPMHLYALCIKSEIIKPHEKILNIIKSNIEQYTTQSIGINIHQFIRLMIYEQKNNKDESQLFIQGLILQLLAELNRIKSQSQSKNIQYNISNQDSAYFKVQQYINQLPNSFYQSQDIDSVVHKIGISRRRFTQLFREITKQSWLQYVRELQLEHAASLLSETNRSIQAICFESGFENISNFYRLFKKQFGLTPNEWRIKNST